MSEVALQTADVVVVAGGILGCSSAWHMRKSTELSVVVLERMTLALAATSQAAGLLDRFGNTDAIMSLVDETYRAIGELAETVGEPLPIAETGALHLAASENACAALEDHVAAASSHGLRVDRPSTRELAARLPWLHTGEIQASAFAADDGYIDPYSLATAYAHAARIRGATIRTGVSVDRILTSGDRVSGVMTTAGRVEAPVVIVAAGVRSNTLTAALGAPLPTAPVRSHYWITEPDPLFPNHHPVVFLPEARAYTRPELGGLVFGLREREAACADPRALPSDLSGFAFSDDADGGRALEDGFADLVRFTPALGRVGIANYICGLSDYTPDGAPVVGPAETIDGLFLVAGCGAGIAVSGGVGLAIADWVSGRETSLDLSAFSPGRFGDVDPFHPSFQRRCAKARSREGGASVR